MRELVVVRAGLFSTVQDRGRFGSRSQGVAQCGAMDDVAYAVANRAVGNPENAPAIEVTLGGAKFRFETDARFALCGGDAAADIDGERVPAWSSCVARAGQTLTLPTSANRMRTVLCVDGGIDVPKILGSRSTDTTAGFGGYEGRPLRDGDRIAIGEALPKRFGDTRFRLKPPQWDFDARAVGVLEGSEYCDFSAEARAIFWNTEWTISSQSNRMGYRLDGPAVVCRQSERPMLSHAVFPGVVQVPPSGRPIVLLRDAQTTGGYPKIGVVVGAHVRAVSQLRPGATLRFRPFSLADAQYAERRLSEYVDSMYRAIESRPIQT